MTVVKELRNASGKVSPNRQDNGKSGNFTTKPKITRTVLGGGKNTGGGRKMTTRSGCGGEVPPVLLGKAKAAPPGI